MPKMIPITEKREWLTLYEQGKSEASIARDKHRDLNVIKRGIQDAKHERNLSLAQAEILRDALRQHQDKLLAVLGNVLKAIVLPSANLELPRKFDSKENSITLPAAQIKYDPQKGLFISLQDEDTLNWELLREHLKGDRLWGKLEKWKRAMIDHVKTRISLKLKAQMILENTTGLKVLDVISNTTSDNYLYFTLVDLFYKRALAEVFQNPDREVFNMEYISIMKPYIRYPKDDKPLAHYPESAESCRSNILSSYDIFLKSTEISKLKESHANLVDITKKTGNMVEEIVLLGIIPGRCRVCRRLGL